MRFQQQRNTFSTATAAIFVLALTASIATAPIEAATVTEQLDETYPLSAGGQLTLDNVNGDVEIAVWDRNEVRIRANKTIRAASKPKAELALAEVQIEIRTENDSIVVDTKHPQRSGFWDWLSSSHVSASVDYQLTVPKRVDLDVVTVNGKVTVRGPHGELSVQTTNGDVELEESGGQADVRTTNGSIRVALEAVTEGSKLSFVTTNGGIRLALPATVHVSVRASTTNGTITTELPIKVEGRLSRRQLRGVLNGGGGSLALRTTNGSIRISEI